VSADLGAELGRLLHGPRRVKGRLIRDAADGFDDTVDAFRAAGIDAGQATSLAVARFGTPGQLAAAYQAELDTAQARRTAILVAMTLPAMFAMWHVGWNLDPYQTWEIPIVPLLVAQSAASFGFGASVWCGLVALGQRTGVVWLPMITMTPDQVAVLARLQLAAMIAAVTVMTAAVPTTVLWPPLMLPAGLTIGLLATLGLSARRTGRCELA
jgi:hypothetical protein